jgi:hypothetical protein
MGGLIVIFIIAFWVFLVTKLTKFLSKWIPVNKYSPALKVLLFVLLLVMPFADEIIGGFQFRALCKAEAVATYDEAKVRGKTVHLKSAEVIHYTNTILPTHKQIWLYADHETNEELLSYVDIRSDGGWLSRWINFNGVHDPQTFSGNCGSDKEGYLFQNLNIKDTDRN